MVSTVRPRIERHPRIVPANVTKRQLIELCLKHGKTIVLNELRQRHSIAQKTGQLVNTVMQGRTISELESMTEQDMQTRLDMKIWVEVKCLAPIPAEEQVREQRRQDTQNWQDQFDQNHFDQAQTDLEDEAGHQEETDEEIETDSYRFENRLRNGLGKWL